MGQQACLQSKLFQKWLPFYPSCGGTYFAGGTMLTWNLRVMSTLSEGL